MKSIKIEVLYPGIFVLIAQGNGAFHEEYEKQGF